MDTPLSATSPQTAPVPLRAFTVLEVVWEAHVTVSRVTTDGVTITTQARVGGPFPDLDLTASLSLPDGSLPGSILVPEARALAVDLARYVAGLGSVFAAAVQDGSDAICQASDVPTP